MELRTIKNVEILEVGEDWHLSTGDITVTTEHLAAAVGAQYDAAVRTAIIKFGHIDPRFNVPIKIDGTYGDGQPSVGRAENLHVSADGMTLLCDFVGIPAWLADAMPVMWPRRSIEGFPNFTTATGRTHLLAISAVALLGDAYPAITTLEDLKLIASAQSVDDITLVAVGDPKEITQASQGADVPNRRSATTQPITASISTDDVRREFYDQLTEEQQWWWIRQHEVSPPQLIAQDDDNGDIYRIGYSIDANDKVVFENPVKVKIVYEDAPTQVAASANNDVVVQFATREQSMSSLPGDHERNQESLRMTPDQLKAIGLPEDATDEQIAEQLAAAAAALAAVETAPEVEPDEEVVVEPETPIVEPVVPETPDLPVPDGHVLVNAKVFEDMNARLGKMDQFLASQAKAEKDAVFSSAIKAGKFPPSERKTYEDLWKASESATRKLIESLPISAAATTELGSGRDGQDEDREDDAYPAGWGASLSAPKEVATNGR